VSTPIKVLVGADTIHPHKLGSGYAAARVHHVARRRGGVVAGGRKGAARRARKTCGVSHLGVIKGRGGLSRCLPGRFAQSQSYRRKKSKTRLSLQRRRREATDAARAGA